MNVRLCDVCAQKVNPSDSACVSIEVTDNRHYSEKIDDGRPPTRSGEYDLCGPCGAKVRTALVRTVTETLVKL